MKKNKILKTVIIVVVLLIPIIYSFFYLKSYWNPYGDLKGVKIAVVNLDKGEDGENQGNELIEELQNDGTFDICSTSLDEANLGMQNGDYYAMITIPSNFTECLNSASSTDKQIATITYSPNQASNYLASQIINSAIKTIELNLQAKIASTVTETLTESLEEVPEQLNKIADGSEEILDGAKSLNSAISQVNSGVEELASKGTDGIETLQEGVTQINQGAESLNDGISTYVEGTNSLASGTISYVEGTTSLLENVENYIDSVDKTNQSVSSLLSAVASLSSSSDPQIQALAKNAQAIIDSNAINSITQGGTSIKTAKNMLTSANDNLTSGAKELISSGDSLKQGSSSLYSGTQQLLEGTKSLSSFTSGITSLKTALEQMQKGSNQLVSGIEEFNTEINSGIQDTNEQLEKLNNLDDFVEDPVEFKTEAYGEVDSYGIAFTPLFLCIGLWVGALMCYVVLYYDQKHRFGVLDSGFKNKLLQNLIYVGLGAFQGIVVGILLKLGLGYDVQNLPLYYGSCVLIGITFMSIISFLIRNFGDVGKLLALIILVLQLAASGGTFPVETIDKGFRAFTNLLPMTYSIKLLREILVPTATNFKVQYILILLGITACTLLITNVVDVVRMKRQENLNRQE